MADLDAFKENQEVKEIDTSKKVRIGIIGTGGIAYSHMDAYCKQPDVEIVAGSDNSEEPPTNSQLYRIYIERYLRSHPKVAQELDLIIAQRQQGEFGLPIEVYFFITDKTWYEYETIQSDIFDHLIAMASEFGLKLYQLPG